MSANSEIGRVQSFSAPVEQESRGRCGRRVVLTAYQLGLLREIARSTGIQSADTQTDFLQHATLPTYYYVVFSLCVKLSTTQRPYEIFGPPTLISKVPLISHLLLVARLGAVSPRLPAKIARYLGGRLWVR